MRPEMKTTRNKNYFCHEKNSVYVSIHCRRKELIFVLFWTFDRLSLLLWNIRMHSHFFRHDFVSGQCLHDIYYQKWNFISGKMTAMKWQLSFILGYFMYAVIRVWPETELKIFHFGRKEIFWKSLQYQKGKKHRQIKLHSLRKV